VHNQSGVRSTINNAYGMEGMRADLLGLSLAFCKLLLKVHHLYEPWLHLP